MRCSASVAFAFFLTLWGDAAFAKPYGTQTDIATIWNGDYNVYGMWQFEKNGSIQCWDKCGGKNDFGNKGKPVAWKIIESDTIEIIFEKGESQFSCEIVERKFMILRKSSVRYIFRL